MPFLRNNFKCEKSFPISLAAAVRNVEECAWNRKLSAGVEKLGLKTKAPKKQNKKQSAQNKERKHYFDINSNRVAEAKSVINIRNS